MSFVCVVESWRGCWWIQATADSGGEEKMDGQDQNSNQLQERVQALTGENVSKTFPICLLTKYSRFWQGSFTTKGEMITQQQNWRP